MHNMNYVPFHAVQVGGNSCLCCSEVTCRVNTRGSGVWDSGHLGCYWAWSFDLCPTLAIQVSSFQGNTPHGGKMQRHSSPLFHQELPCCLLLLGWVPCGLISHHNPCSDMNLNVTLIEAEDLASTALSLSCKVGGPGGCIGAPLSCYLRVKQGFNFDVS